MPSPHQGAACSPRHPTVGELLAAGGIHRTSRRFDDAEAVLAWLVEAARWPATVDRPALLRQLIEREAQSSTGIGSGIAIPHPGRPDTLGAGAPLLALGLLEHPAPFRAVDGLPVHAFFLALAPAVAWHLRLMSCLAALLDRGDVASLLAPPAASDAEILALLKRIE